MTDPKPLSEQDATTTTRLIKLQQHSRANIPATLANRATSTFSLHNEPVPLEANARVLVVVYPQDPFVGEPEVRTMNQIDIAPGLVNSRVRMVDGRGELAQPDLEGNYLFWPGTPQFDQVNAFYYTTFTLRMYERYAKRALPWSFANPRITVDPAAGTKATAYYAEQDRLLGFHTFEMDGERFSTAWSADIVTHEAAHAVLDGLRDLYNESFGLGPGAFHESFGDMTAMLVALHDDSLVRRLLDWTENDLTMDNFVAQVAEQLTEALRVQQLHYLRGHSVYLRNAINSLTYQPFDDLPYRPEDPDLQLGRQVHNYSRLFTGAFYDILTGIYDILRAEIPPHIAIYRARDIAANLLVNAIELGPVGEFTFPDMARAFLAADHVVYHRDYHAVMRHVFIDRALLSEDEINGYMASLRDLPTITLPETINSALASALFLEKHVIAKLNIPETNELIPLAAYRNAAGYTFLTYFEVRPTVINDPQFADFDGAEVDMFGGLSLMFDRDGVLRSAMYRPVNDEDIRQMEILTAELIAEGLIVPAEAIADMPAGDQTREIMGVRQEADQTPDDKKRLVRAPAIVDAMPQRIVDFVDYLRHIQKRD